MKPPPLLDWLFPTLLFLCTAVSFAWGFYGFIIWWLLVLSFFGVSVILALFGIFLPDPCLWMRDRLMARKFRSNK